MDNASSSRTSICMLVDKPLPNERATGIGIAAFEMALALSRRKNEVYYITKGRKEGIQNLNDHLTVESLRHFTRSNLSAAKDVFARRRFDIVHVHSSSAVLTLLLGRAMGFCTISHAHGIESRRPLSLAIRRGVAMLAAQAVVATAEGVRQEIVRTYHVPIRKIMVVPNGVDCEEFHPALGSREILKKYGLENFEAFILSVVSMTPAKGPLNFVECLPGILGVRPSMGYVNVSATSEDVYFEKVNKRVAELGISRSVRFLSGVPREDLVNLMNSAYMCVHPSTRVESANDLAVMEEMACGKAVIAFSKDLLSRTIDHNVNGILVRSDDSRSLTKPIIKLLEDRKFASKLGQSARDKAKQQLSWNETARKLEEIYSKFSE